MSAVETPVVPVEPGHFHRIALAARHEDGYVPWLTRVLGAVEINFGIRQVQGMPFGDPEADGWMSASAESGAAKFDMLWLRSTPICIVIGDGDSSPVGRFIERNGPGLHSIAWTVHDMWKTDAQLRRAEFRITGVDIEGRHFFVHPSDTAGLLIELTDTEFARDPRDEPSLLPPAPSDSVVKGAEVAWLGAVVADPVKSAEVLTRFIEASVVDGLPRVPGERAVDLRVNDVVIRLAQRVDGDTRRDQLDCLCLKVPDLDDTCARLEAAGIGIERRMGAFAWTRAEDTLGMKIQWVQA